MSLRAHRARIISLVASLSAFAILGRIMFAPFPNIKPVSALIIIVGAIFGPRVGLAVAICTTLGSNLFFGHGPWTIWQILAWGLMGITSGLIGNWIVKGPTWFRWSWVFVWGFFFGWIMNGWTWWAFYPHTWSAWLIVCAQSFLFDLAHASANIGFIAIGWPLVKPMYRFKSKLSGVILLAFFMLIIPNSFNQSAFAAQTSTEQAIQQACPIINSFTNNRSDDWTVLAAYFHNAESVCKPKIKGIKSTEPLTPFTALTDIERHLIALSSLPESEDVKRTIFIYQNIIQAAQRSSGAFADQLNGQGETLVNSHVYAILSLYSSGGKLNDKEQAIAYLRVQQHENGSFYWSAEANSKSSSDPDMTAMALIAAKVLGLTRDDPLVIRAFDRIHQWQNENGGFLSIVKENAETNAAIIQALIAWKEQIVNWTTTNGNTPIDALLKFQREDGGFSHAINGKSNPMSTIQSYLALQAVANQLSVYDWLHVRMSKQSSLKAPFHDISGTSSSRSVISSMVALHWIPPVTKNMWKPSKLLSIKDLQLILKSIDPTVHLKIIKSTNNTLFSALQLIKTTKLVKPIDTSTLTRLQAAQLIYQWFRAL